MIEFDYHIQRDEGDEVKNYYPDKIPKELPNLVYIEGPNSSGKSTLLHLIGLSFFGVEKTNKSINPALRRKMLDLIDSKHQKVKFNIKITSRNGNVILFSNKPDFNSDIERIEILGNEKYPLLWESFKEKYNLIYDIPDNPTERLIQLINTINTNQNNIGHRVEVFETYLKNIINNIQDSYNPDAIDQLKKNLTLSKNDLIQIEKELNLSEKEYVLLKKYTYCNNYNHYLLELEKNENILRGLKVKQGKNVSKKKKVNKKWESLRNDLTESLIELQKLKYELTNILEKIIPNDNKHILEMWSKLNLSDAKDNLEFSNLFTKGITTFKLILYDIEKEKDNNENLLKAKLIQDLIQFLKQYESIDVTIPGIDSSIKNFILKLESERSKYENLIIESENISNAKDLLDRIATKKDYIEKKYFPELIKIQKEFKDKMEIFTIDDDCTKEIETLSRNIKNIEKYVEHYENECIKLNIDTNNFEEILLDLNSINELQPYHNYTENQLLEKISNLQNNIEDLKEKRDEKKFHINQYLNDIETLENKKPHKYQEHLEDLNRILNTCQILRQKLLTKYPKLINKILERNYSSMKNVPDEEKNYYEKVSRYLGRKIGEIRHINSEYKVDKVDLISNIIYTKSGKQIRLTEMGTGQSQSAYLLGKLNSSDDRKIIALFDEVAMMDKESLKPIFKKLKELYESDKLLIGIVVQIGDSIKVIPKI